MLSQVTVSEVDVPQVMEHVSAAEPVVSVAPRLKEKLEGYQELCKQSVMLGERVKEMEARQRELERLIQTTSEMVTQVRVDGLLLSVGSSVDERGDPADPRVARSVVKASLLSHILTRKDVCALAAFPVGTSAEWKSRIRSATLPRGFRCFSSKIEEKIVQFTAVMILTP